MSAFASTVAGIPCQVHIIGRAQPGNIRATDSDWDYLGRGHEWEVCDRGGRTAPWLERKLSPYDIARISKEIDDFFADQ
jgi:hypothetical protein